MEPQKNETSVHMESKRYPLTGDKPPDFSLSLCSVILPSIPYQITILWFCTVLEGFLFPQYSYNFTLYVSGGFPGGSAGKESSCNVENLGLIPRLGWSPAEGNSYPLQYSGLENSKDCVVSPWGHKELDMTRQLSLYFTYVFGITLWANGQNAGISDLQWVQHL